MESVSFDLKAKKAIVTGGSRGIGKSIAYNLSKAGVDVVITSRNEESLKKASEEIMKATGNKVIPIVADFSNLNDINNMVEQSIKELGKVDILVNNAGISILDNALDVKEEDWDKVMDINLKSLFFCSQYVARHMKENGGGKVIHIASQAGKVALPRHAAYCASKGAVVLLTQVMAVEWAEFGINVNAIGPTTVETEMTIKMLEDKETRDYIYSNIALKRVGKPVDVAGAVIFLASPAADLITGEHLLIDGGWTAW